MWQITKPAFAEITTPNPFQIVDFSPAALKAFEKYLAELYENEIPYAVLNFSSYGGDVGCMAGFMSLMDSFRKKGVVFCGYVSGYAMSAAAVIFLYCDNNFRFMGRFASLMIHNTLCGHSHDRVSAMKKYADFYNKNDELVNECISLHIKKPKNWLAKQLQARSNDDWVLTAAEAKELNLCEIGTPIFNLEVKSEFQVTFE